MQRREIINDATVIIAGIILLVIGVIHQLMRPEGYYGYENNQAILIGEIILFASLFVLAIERLCHDTKEGFREIAGDIVSIAGAGIITGMFIVILFTGKFFMYQVEPLFIAVRTIAAIGFLVLGVDRLLNDIRY